MKRFQQIYVDHKSPISIHQQLRHQIALLIVGSELKIGDQLPAIRQLADQLDISMHTVRHAYQQLELDGLVEIRHGRRTKVLPLNLANMIKQAGEIRSQTIGVILPALDPYSVSILEGIETIASENQYMLTLSVSHQYGLIAIRDLAHMITSNIDGCLIVNHDSLTLVDSQNKLEPISGVPFVSIEWPNPNVYCVQMDRESGGYQATKHLIDLGHQQIALITYKIDVPQILSMNLGYKRALEEAGIPFDPSLISRVLGFDFTAGVQGMKNLFTLEQLPTAIITVTDAIALGAMQTIKDHNYRIPDDISVVGFNNTPRTDLVDPPLTTVAAPTYQIGQEATKMLLQLIEGSIPPQHEIVLPTTLIIRQSSGRNQHLN